MKTTTLWQPWASLVAVGTKTIETRSWSTNYRGPLAIHAAVKQMANNAAEIYWDNTEVLRPQTRIAEPRWQVLPFGAVVATCELVDVVPTESIEWCEGNLPVGLLPCDRPGGWMLRPSDGFRFRVYAREAQRPYGDYTPGRFAWLLDDIVALDPPVPAKGHQQLWEWTPAPTNP